MRFDANYNRVMPRDLFNEAKLLKCLGRLLVLHVDERLSDECIIEHVNQGDGFVIGQDSSDGSISCTNVRMWHVMPLPDNKRVRSRIYLYTPVNSQEPYPLIFSIGGFDAEELPVFDDEGNMSPEFYESFGYKNRHDQEG
jgi:hypothetical protein